jgi:hypothetical protein
VLTRVGSCTPFGRLLALPGIEQHRFTVDSYTVPDNVETLLRQGVVEDWTVAARSLGSRKDALLLELVVSASAYSELLAQLLQGYETMAAISRH